MPRTSSEIIESEIKPYVKDWESPKLGEEHYSTNQLIAAYEAGVARGTMGFQSLLREQFEKNIEKAGVDTRKLVNKLQEYGLKPTAARLKVCSWEQFEVLITLPEGEYLDERIENVYDFVGELESATQEDHYYIAFRFCPEIGGFDEQKVKSDGYTLLHKSLVK